MVTVAIREPVLTAVSRAAKPDGGVETDERPEDCECTELCKLPGWYCYAEGFEEPNPNVEEAE